MQILSTTEARKRIKDLVSTARYEGAVYGIGRRDRVEAIVIGFPAQYDVSFNDITNINTYSRSFDFLADEPDVYSVSDVKRRYAQR